MSDLMQTHFNEVGIDEREKVAHVTEGLITQPSGVHMSEYMSTGESNVVNIILTCM